MESIHCRPNEFLPTKFVFVFPASVSTTGKSSLPSHSPSKSPYLTMYIHKNFLPLVNTSLFYYTLRTSHPSKHFTAHSLPLGTTFFSHRSPTTRTHIHNLLLSRALLSPNVLSYQLIRPLLLLHRGSHFLFHHHRLLTTLPPNYDTFPSPQPTLHLKSSLQHR